MNEYLSLANFILPEGMLDWFNPNRSLENDKKLFSNDRH